MDFNKIVDLLDYEKKTLLTQALLLLGPTAASPAASQSSERLAASTEGSQVKDKNSAGNEPEGETSSKFVCVRVCVCVCDVLSRMRTQL